MLAAGRCLSLTLSVCCCAAAARAQSTGSDFGSPAAFTLAPKLGELRHQSTAFAFQFTDALLLDDARAWEPRRSHFAESVASTNNTFTFLSSSDVGRRRKRAEPSWKPADALADFTGIPPVEREKSGFGQAVARGALGFLIGRVVSELAGDRQANKSQVSVRSASDPHGKGVGLGLSATW
jgi:hypothetical protein